MRKIIELEDRFATGEPTTQAVLLWGPSGRPLIERTKEASEAHDYLKSVNPQPGKTIVLVIALGGYSTWGVNRNGDAFPDAPVKQGHQAKCGCCKADPGGWITQEEILQNHYKTFEQMGRVYLHHINKDPAGSVGDVIKAFWNDRMRRVELLIGIDNTKAAPLVQRINDGEFPAWSMGCRIREDRCAICMHRAPTRKQYCDHLKFNMRQVMPNGEVAAALNPSPKFFDISAVIKPADLTGYMMRKVAYAYEIKSSAAQGEYLDNVEEKRAAIRKVADMDKIVRGIPVDAKSSPLPADQIATIEKFRDSVMPAIVGQMPTMDDQTIGNLAKHPVANVLSTMSAAGVILTTPEFVKLIVERMAPGTKVPEEALDAIVALQGHVFDLYAQHPQMLDQVMQTGLFDINAKNVDPVIGEKAERYLEKRSSIGDFLQRALIPPILRKEEPHWSDSLHVKDPGTGDTYETNRGAAVAAHDQIAKRQLGKMLGGGALLAGGYKLLAAGLPPMLRPIAAGTAGLLGYKHLKPDFGPQYMTEEGIPISTLTELSPQDKTGGDFSSVALPTLGIGALVTALGHDYDTRLRRGMVGDPYAPTSDKILERMGGYAAEHPALSFLSALGAYGIGSHALGKFAAHFEGIRGAATDGVELPDVDIDLAAEKLGALLLS
jgi:hypothetical protein